MAFFLIMGLDYFSVLLEFFIIRWNFDCVFLNFAPCHCINLILVRVKKNIGRLRYIFLIFFKDVKIVQIKISSKGLNV